MQLKNLSVPPGLESIRVRGTRDYGLMAIRLCFENGIDSPIFDVLSSTDKGQRPLTIFKIDKTQPIKAISAKVFQSSFIYKLSFVDPENKEPDRDIIGEMSSCGYLETRIIPPDHVIAGIYGTKRHPKGAPKRMTSLGFILMRSQTPASIKAKT